MLLSLLAVPNTLKRIRSYDAHFLKRSVSTQVFGWMILYVGKKMKWQNLETSWKYHVAVQSHTQSNKNFQIEKKKYTLKVYYESVHRNWFRDPKCTSIFFITFAISRQNPHSSMWCIRKDALRACHCPISLKYNHRKRSHFELQFVKHLILLQNMHGKKNPQFAAASSCIVVAKW